MNRTALAIAALALAGTAASADVFEFQMFNHPDGAVAPPYYGLRVDNMFGEGNVNTFSIDTIGDSVLTVNEDGEDISIHMEGTLYGGTDSGVTTGGGALYTYTWDYTEGVEKTANGWRVVGMSGANGGALTRVSDGAEFSFTTKTNGSDVAFIFQADGHRISGDADAWVGRGWVMSQDNPRGQHTQDWLFSAEVVPAPGTVALGAMGGLLVTRRRRKN
ncbi:MAG: PEP-CTERM sorting domain-containing protein [Phycisphaerales bacterium JB059]